MRAPTRAPKVMLEPIQDLAALSSVVSVKRGTLSFLLIVSKAGEVQPSTAPMPSWKVVVIVRVRHDHQQQQHWTLTNGTQESRGSSQVEYGRGLLNQFCFFVHISAGFFVIRSCKRTFAVERRPESCTSSRLLTLWHTERKSCVVTRFYKRTQK